MSCNCPLNGRRVSGEGPLDPRIVLIGEAPGAEEERLGRPFIGRSGQLLRTTLAKYNIDVETECYITNVVKCRPPDNRNPTKEEIAACREQLEGELDATGQPEWYVFVGAVAAEALLGCHVSMLARVNRTMLWRNTRTTIIYHPAYVLRNPQAMAKFEGGIRLLMKPPTESTQQRLF